MRGQLHKKKDGIENLYQASLLFLAVSFVNKRDEIDESPFRTNDINWS